MRTIAMVLALLFLTAGCGNSVVEKPKNLIEESKMVNIIYDLSILEALKSQKPLVLEKDSINPNTYIYKKYNIDSLQFVKSNQYYASDLAEYKKIYEQVSQRLQKNDKNKAQHPDPNAGVIQ